ncbi:MAG: Clp protease ClpC, partial [Paludibacter sp.]
MPLEYTNSLNNSLKYSWQEAERLGNNYVGPEHLLLGLIRESHSNKDNILNKLQAKTDTIKENIEAQIRTEERVDATEITLLKSTEKIQRFIELEARVMSDDKADDYHLLLAILKENNSLASDVLEKEDIVYMGARYFINQEKERQTFEQGAGLKKVKVVKNSVLPPEEDEEDDAPTSKSGKTTEKTTTKGKSDTPVLDTFGTDITKSASENKLDPIVGRDKEIERLAQILSRRKKNNPVLIGEPGVGKSAIVEGLALRIVQKKVSRILFDKRVISLDMASIVAGTKYRGQFEERIKAMLNELKNNKNVILF